MEKSIQELEAIVRSKMSLCTSIKESCTRENRNMREDELESFKKNTSECDQFLSEIEMRKLQGRINGTYSSDIPKPQLGETRSSSSGPFKSFGDQLQAIYRASNSSLQVDPRLYQVRVASGMSEETPSEGGYLLQEAWSGDLMKTAFQTGKLASMCYQIQMSGNSSTINLPMFDEPGVSRATARLGGVIGYWIGAAAQITGSMPKVRNIKLVLHKLAVLAYATDELVQDSALLERMIQLGFGTEIGFQLDDKILNGSGVAEPLGVLNSGALITITKESGQLANTIQVENIMNMFARLMPGSASSAVWVCNQNIIPQLYTMGVSVGVGGVPVYMPANSIAGLPYSTILGRPVLYCENSPSLSSAGDLLLADFSNGYALATKGGAQTASGLHVRFIFDEMAYRCIYRCDGQPVLSAPITPAKGDSVSHFVALGAR